MSWIITFSNELLSLNIILKSLRFSWANWCQLNVPDTESRTLKSVTLSKPCLKQKIWYSETLFTGSSNTKQQGQRFLLTESTENSDDDMSDVLRSISSHSKQFHVLLRKLLVHRIFCLNASFSLNIFKRYIHRLK